MLCSIIRTFRKEMDLYFKKKDPDNSFAYKPLCAGTIFDQSGSVSRNTTNKVVLSISLAKLSLDFR